MDREMLEAKIKEIQESMKNMDVKSQEYDKLLTKLKETYKLLADFEANELDYFIKGEEHKLTEAKFDAEQDQNRVKNEQAKKDRCKDILKVAITGVLGVTSVVIVVYAEGTRIVTSKAFSIATKMLPLAKI